MRGLRYWCQACGAHADAPCDVVGHRSERLYWGRDILGRAQLTRYARPKVTEAVQGAAGVEHLAVES